MNGAVGDSKADPSELVGHDRFEGLRKRRESAEELSEGGIANALLQGPLRKQRAHEAKPSRR